MSRRIQITGIVGWLGSAFAALCCIGFSALVGLLGAIGAGFLIQDRILIPLLAASLLISVTGLFGAHRRDRNLVALLSGLIGALVTFVSILSVWTPGVYTGLGLLLIATSWNIASGIRAFRKERDQDPVQKKAA